MLTCAEELLIISVVLNLIHILRLNFNMQIGQ